MGGGGEEGSPQAQVGGKYIDRQKEMRERREHGSTRDDREAENTAAAASRQEQPRPNRDLAIKP